jgi:low affinity Fe/Cu permease
MKDHSVLFGQFSNRVATRAGNPLTFALACLIIVIWLLTGPLFHWTDTWQLVMNTITSIITFLMVFVIQNTQNREGVAMQIKLDEIIRALAGAHNAILNLEELTDEDLTRIRARYRRIAETARAALERGHMDTDQPEIRPA